MVPGFAMVKTHAVDRPAKMHENAFIVLSFPVLLCSRHACKNRSKSSKIHHKMITKNTKPGVAMIKNTRRRPTCENAQKRVHFCRSRCCFAHAMDAEFVQNRRKSSTGACNVSTVGPAARRANSKCIWIEKASAETDATPMP